MAIYKIVPNIHIFYFIAIFFLKKITHYSPSQTITQHMRDYATKKKHPLQPVSAPL